MRQERPVVADADREAYLDEMVLRRGYALPYHKATAEADLPVLKAADNLAAAAYLSQRTLGRGTMELLFILSLTVLKAERHHIASRIRTALPDRREPAGGARGHRDRAARGRRRRLPARIRGVVRGSPRDRRRTQCWCPS